MDFNIKICCEKEILEISRMIYDFAEIGSKEYKSSNLLAEKLSKHNFKVIKPYLGMETAFRAEYGGGKYSVGILAEYDALPNGHSCGHNLIAAWAYGVAVNLSKILNDAKIVVFGTPSEEGIGEYAGSKAKMVEEGAFKDVDFVVGMHPDDSWNLGAVTLADVTSKATFIGKSSHVADSPEKGINALDAAVASYVNINMFRDKANVKDNLVIGMVFRECGYATNVIPERAVLEIDMRSSSGEFLEDFENKIKNLILSTSNAFGAKCQYERITPLYSDYLNNETINDYIEMELKKLNIHPRRIDKEKPFPSGSTDEANVSKVVPTGHIDIKIGYPGIPGHSDDFRIASNPENAKESLLIGIHAVYNAIINIFKDNAVERIKDEFNKKIKG
ncbi:MAG: M20 family metallopeptidase [Thermoplasmata archaeon]|jgi:amidohydrolase